MSKQLIICHGDGDGIISAAVLLKQMPDAEVVITQPFLIGKISVPDEVEEIYIVDIAVDNHNPRQTIDFVSAHFDKIVLWADHHVGTEMLSDTLGNKLLFNIEMPSCPALLDDAGYLVPAHLRHAANACDRPTQFSPTDLSTLYNQAFKVALVELRDGNKAIVEKIQRQFLSYLLTGEKGDLQSYSDCYAPLFENTEKAVGSMIELLPNVGFVVLGSESIDKTAVFIKGYEKYPYVVLQWYENKQPITTIATNAKTNLVELFGLGSGAPFRVNLSATTGHGETHELQLKEVFSKISSK